MQTRKSVTTYVKKTEHNLNFYLVTSTYFISILCLMFLTMHWTCKVTSKMTKLQEVKISNTF